MNKKQIELDLLDDLINATKKNNDWVYSKEEIITWLERQRFIINND